MSLTLQYSWLLAVNQMEKKIREGFLFCVCHPLPPTTPLKEKQAARSCGKCRLYVIALCLGPAVVTQGLLRIVSSAMFLRLHRSASSCYRKQMSAVSGFLVCPGNCLLTGKGAVSCPASPLGVLGIGPAYLPLLVSPETVQGNPGDTAACFFYFCLWIQAI